MTRQWWLASAMLFAAACLRPSADLARPSDEEPLSIWVLDHGWHTAIVVRRADLDRALWPAVDDFPGATFVEVAWGDREFYMATPATVWMAMKAAFGTGGSVLHVVGFDATSAVLFPRSDGVELRISRAGFAALTRFIADEHARDPAGRYVRLQRGLYGSSWFYAARSRYSLGNTCNTWIARALQTAGLPVTPSGVITASTVMEQVKSAREAR